MAVKLVNGTYLCGTHGHQVAHGLLMGKLEQDTNQLLLEANAEALGQQLESGRPVLLG